MGGTALWVSPACATRRRGHLLFHPWRAAPCLSASPSRPALSFPREAALGEGGGKGNRGLSPAPLPSSHSFFPRAAGQGWGGKGGRGFVPSPPPFLSPRGPLEREASTPAAATLGRPPRGVGSDALERNRLAGSAGSRTVDLSSLCRTGRGSRGSRIPSLGLRRRRRSPLEAPHRRPEREENQSAQRSSQATAFAINVQMRNIPLPKMIGAFACRQQDRGRVGLLA